jgi:hypothetical protein
MSINADGNVSITNNLTVSGDIESTSLQDQAMIMALTTY